MADITRNDASELKKVVQSLPVNRNTKPETRDLPLMEAIQVTGVQKVSVETVNNHLAMFFRFWDWAERHGHAPHKLFEGMKVAKTKRAKGGRKAYTKEQTAKLYAELTENHSGLVKKDDHKWGALLGLYTGARLNEIAQLEHDLTLFRSIRFVSQTYPPDEPLNISPKADAILDRGVEGTLIFDI